MHVYMQGMLTAFVTETCSCLGGKLVVQSCTLSMQTWIET